ncbi:MAG: 5-(carboxyamino)imidazole ribonucleotide synthase [Flavobacteriales bacterium]|nr:5-(carboxyamino)imidazole ribonucleotide synthase [Flavobacteriales bacterium]
MTSTFENKISSYFRLGIISGGQLGKMLAQHAAQWDIESFVLDMSANCPAAFVAKHQTGSPQNEDDVYHFGKTMDVVLLEMENVNLKALRKLEQEGVQVFPRPDTLEIIQDKWKQKEFLVQNGFPVAKGTEISNVKNGSDVEGMGISLPTVLKAKVGGYDGKGVQVIKQKDDEILLPEPLFAEEMVALDKELSVIVVRDIEGNVRCYDPVEMVFDDASNLLDYLVFPAEVSESVSQKAMSMAEDIISKLNHVGLLAIEFFVDGDDVIVNEMAPRPHNSGHQTIESAYTSQYEQLLRATLGAPLGNTKIKVPSILYNITGSATSLGKVSYDAISDVMKMSNVNVHIYGKRQVKPFRKMGHLVLYGNQMSELKDQLKLIKTKLKINGK